MEEFLRLQAELDSYVAQVRRVEVKPIELCRAIIHETVELEDELGWKWWKTRKEADLFKVKEEAIDVLHFLLSLFLKLGMDAEEVRKLYKQKWQINMNRQNNGY
jgi:dimeric dUTPase (all-alpha-NTP-PPase superfamily)